MMSEEESKKIEKDMMDKQVIAILILGQSIANCVITINRKRT